MARLTEFGRSGATASLRFGSRAVVQVEVTSAALLSIGALVSSILLSSAVIVVAAGRQRALLAQLPPPDAGVRSPAVPS